MPAAAQHVEPGPPDPLLRGQPLGGRQHGVGRRVEFGDRRDQFGGRTVPGHRVRHRPRRRAAGRRRKPSAIIAATATRGRANAES